MRCVVTGATGLVGANLAIELANQGYQVRCTRRRTSHIQHLTAFDFEWVEADLNDLDALESAFQGAQAVFHCAAGVSVRNTPTPALLGANVQGTAHVLRAARQARVERVVHCSSVVAVGLSENGQPVDESAPWNFDKYGLDDGYTVTKRDSERLAAQASAEQDVVIVNPTYMFGPYDQRPSSGELILRLARRKLPVLPPGRSNFVDVRRVAAGMVAALERGQRGQRYILGGQNLSYAEVFQRIAELSGQKPPSARVPAWMMRFAGRCGDLVEWLSDRDVQLNSSVVRWGLAQNFQFSTALAERELGYDPGDYESGVIAALAWFRDNGRL